jgi:hypothetical protein
MKTTKTNQIVKTILLFTIFFFLSTATMAQTETTPKNDTLYMITTNDGGEFVGKVISDDGREVVITDRTKGKVIIPKYAIKNMEKVNQSNVVGNKIVHANPHPSRYLFSPSAIALKKGEGYMNWFYFLLFQMQYGITDNFSAGITTSWLLAPTMLNLKYTAPLADNFSVAVGGQVGKLWITDDNVVSLGFASATYGTSESNVSLNVGYGSYDRDGITIATLSGVHRIGENASVMGEFWYCQPTGGNPFFMGGPALRLYSGRKATFDIALLVLGFQDDFYNYNGDGYYDPNTGNYKPGTYTKTTRWQTYYPLPLLSISYKL